MNISFSNVEFSRNSGHFSCLLADVTLGEARGYLFASKAPYENTYKASIQLEGTPFSFQGANVSRSVAVIEAAAAAARFMTEYPQFFE